MEFFAQDNWKVSSRLTLDYGIRFYWIQPQFDEALQTTNCRRSSGSRKGPGSNYGWTPSTRLNHTQFDTINSTLNVTSLTNPTPTNLASENGNRTGFRAVTTVRPPRNMQISARFQF